MYLIMLACAEYRGGLLNDQGNLIAALEELQDFRLRSLPSQLIKNIEQSMNVTSLRPNQTAPPVLALDFEEDTVPSFHVATMVIPHFSRASHLGNVLVSEPHHSAGLVWRLRVHCNGKADAAAGFCISIYLELIHGSQDVVPYEFRIELEPSASAVASHKAFVRSTVADFKMGASAGYDYFWPLDRLKSEGFLSPEDDTVTLKFAVRALSFAQKCRDLTAHIAQLEIGAPTEWAKDCTVTSLDVGTRATHTDAHWQRLFAQDRSSAQTSAQTARDDSAANDAIILESSVPRLGPTRAPVTSSGFGMMPWYAHRSAPAAEPSEITSASEEAGPPHVQPGGLLGSRSGAMPQSRSFSDYALLGELFPSYPSLGMSARIPAVPVQPSDPRGPVTSASPVDERRRSPSGEGLVFAVPDTDEASAFGDISLSALTDVESRETADATSAAVVRNRERELTLADDLMTIRREVRTYEQFVQNVTDDAARLTFLVAQYDEAITATAAQQPQLPVASGPVPIVPESDDVITRIEDDESSEAYSRSASGSLETELVRAARLRYPNVAAEGVARAYTPEAYGERNEEAHHSQSQLTMNSGDEHDDEVTAVGTTLRHNENTADEPRPMNDSAAFEQPSRWRQIVAAGRAFDERERNRDIEEGEAIGDDDCFSTTDDEGMFSEGEGTRDGEDPGESDSGEDGDHPDNDDANISGTEGGLEGAYGHARNVVGLLKARRLKRLQEHQQQRRMLLYETRPDYVSATTPQPQSFYQLDLSQHPNLARIQRLANENLARCTPNVVAETPRFQQLFGSDEETEDGSDPDEGDLDGEWNQDNDDDDDDDDEDEDGDVEGCAGEAGQVLLATLQGMAVASQRQARKPNRSTASKKSRFEQ
ncbi:Tripartite motif containing 37 [Thoreauomyces humboldtii]|nr:Tripartite motif containing 37 [Thoreauomyces humboldtii]